MTDSDAVLAAAVLELADAEAREVALYRLEMAYRCVASGHRLDVAARDAAWVAERLTAGVDRDVAGRLALAERVLARPTLGAIRRQEAKAA